MTTVGSNGRGSSLVDGRSMSRAETGDGSRYSGKSSLTVAPVTHEVSKDGFIFSGLAQNSSDYALT